MKLQQALGVLGGRQPGSVVTEDRACDCLLTCFVVYRRSCCLEPHCRGDRLSEDQKLPEQVATEIEIAMCADEHVTTLRLARSLRAVAAQCNCSTFRCGRFDLYNQNTGKEYTAKFRQVRPACHHTWHMTSSRYAAGTCRNCCQMDFNLKKNSKLRADILSAAEDALDAATLVRFSAEVRTRLQQCHAVLRVDGVATCFTVSQHYAKWSTALQVVVDRGGASSATAGTRNGGEAQGAGGDREEDETRVPAWHRGSASYHRSVQVRPMWPAEGLAPQCRRATVPACHSAGVPQFRRATVPACHTPPIRVQPPSYCADAHSGAFSLQTKYRQMQTRSADEPMTTFVSCVVCGV
jgi:hypothetical protein